MQNAPKLKASSARLWMLHRYETDYGIFDHDSDRAEYSMAIVEQHWAENVGDGCPLYERMVQFEERRVPAHFGLSWKEFQDLPTHQCTKILEICAKRERERSTAEQNSVNQLADKLRGL